MELSNTPTKPSTRTVLEFTENELVEALVMYADHAGYEFEAGKMFVWHPTDHPHDKKTTKLVIDKEGSMEPLIRQTDAVEP